jgi:predicted nuclease with TOPRIM domain
MDETRPPEYNPNIDPRHYELARPRRKLHPRWLVFASAFALIAALAIAYAHVDGERQRSDELTAANQNLANSLSRVQNEIQAMSERFTELQARTAPPAESPRALGPPRGRPAGQANVSHSDQLRRIQSRLSEQQKQIAGAREDIDRTKSDLSQTRDDLQNNINSAKSELNGSIARTHDDVVALEKRGERNYYEFAIDKSKQYSRVGPLSIALRKADTKHRRFNLSMQVDDNELQKNSVNLYETVWISLSDRPQPVELVVNKITKNHIEGYLSEPKYKKSELQSAASVNPGTNPVGSRPKLQ